MLKGRVGDREPRVAYRSLPCPKTAQADARTVDPAEKLQTGEDVHGGPIMRTEIAADARQSVQYASYTTGWRG